VSKTVVVNNGRGNGIATVVQKEVSPRTSFIITNQRLEAKVIAEMR
jgi:hypothetical protein